LSKLLLYVHESAAETVYADLITSLNVECEVVRSFADFYQRSVGAAYSGFMVDIVSSIKAPPFDRVVIKELMDVYPSLRLRWDPKSGEVRTLMTGAGAGQKISIAYFVSAYCADFTPRALRLRPRKNINCSVVWSVHPQMPDEDIKRTVTVDISAGGCFLYSAYSIEIGTILWLRFVDLVDNAPIKFQVLWLIEWGRSTMMPGWGGKFLHISDAQLAEISALIEGESGD